MKHRLLAVGLSVGLLTMTLAGCSSFAPVYGGAAGGAEHVRFNFASPDNRLEQIMFDRLKVAFPGTPSPADPVLDINASASTVQGAASNAFAVARPVNVRVEATVTVSWDNASIFQATRFSDTAYQSGKLVPVDLASKAGAEETAAASVAESIRAAILAEM